MTFQSWWSAVKEAAKETPVRIALISVVILIVLSGICWGWQWAVIDLVIFVIFTVVFSTMGG